MAKRIEPTPTLEGEDAKAFWKCMEKTKFDPKKEIELARSKAIYEHLFPKE